MESVTLKHSESGQVLKTGPKTVQKYLDIGFEVVGGSVPEKKKEAPANQAPSATVEDEGSNESTKEV